MRATCATSLMSSFDREARTPTWPLRRSAGREARTPTWPIVAVVARFQAGRVRKIHDGVATAGDDLGRPKLDISLHFWVPKNTAFYFGPRNDQDTVGIEPLKL